FREYALGAIALRNAFEFGHNPPAWLGLRKAEMNRLLLRRDLDALDLFQLLDPALDLFGLGGLNAKSINERLELFNSVALVCVSSLQRGEPLRFQFLVLAVAAGV